MAGVEIDFSNTQTAYSLKTKKELRLAKFMFSVLQSAALSSIGRSLLKFAVAAKLPVKGVVKATLFKHFIGGESIKATKPLMKRLYEHKVGCILDYSLEGIDTEIEFDKAVDEFKANVIISSERKEVPFSVFKPSAIATHKILEKVTAQQTLNQTETAEFNRVRQRFHSIFALASEKNVRVMIDAEETWIQGAIDMLALEMMRDYNKGKVIALNTYQMYRHDRLEFIKKNLAEARENDFYFGAKLVRGAYMEKERERALKMNYSSPINLDKEATDNLYNEAAEICLRNIDNCEVFIGTHNEISVKNAASIMSELGLENSDERVWFSQLYGMCDYITFNIARLGYNVAKYVPYGPVNAVIPYLIRRADENSSVTGQAVKELRLINEEIKRRG